MSRVIYLKSYDRYNEILKYHLPSGEFSILMEEKFKALGLPLTFGSFCNEGPQVAGLFASPDGPVFFLDKRQVVCRFGETAASVSVIPGESKNRFTFTHKPYDNEEEDIDLLALIASNLRFEASFRAYTKDWAGPEAQG
jgi:hypothetical protein